MNHDIRRIILATIALFTLGACASEPAVEESALGTVSLALTSTGANGVTYRLRGTEAVLSGATYAVIDLDAAYVDVPVIDVRIAEGDYELGLKDGWFLERNAGHGYQVVEAQLVSPNPQFFSVKHEQITAIALNFQAGTDAITFGSGDLEVTIGVKPECQEGEWFSRGCGPGFTWNQTATCMLGIWFGKPQRCSPTCL